MIIHMKYRERIISSIAIPHGIFIHCGIAWSSRNKPLIFIGDILRDWTTRINMDKDWRNVDFCTFNSCSENEGSLFKLFSVITNLVCGGNTANNNINLKLLLWHFLHVSHNDLIIRMHLIKMNLTSKQNQFSQHSAVCWGMSRFDSDEKGSKDKMNSVYNKAYMHKLSTILYEDSFLHNRVIFWLYILFRIVTSLISLLQEFRVYP